MSLIIGLDPGSQWTGFGILRVVDNEHLQYQEHGILDLSKTPHFAAKLHALYESLNQIFLQWKPQEAIIEKVFLGSNVDSAFKLGHARGICLALASRYGCVIREASPRSVKKIVTGYGAASKEQMAMAVANWLNLNTQGIRHDATDALGLSIARALQMIGESRLKKIKEIKVGLV